MVVYRVRNQSTLDAFLTRTITADNVRFPKGGLEFREEHILPLLHTNLRALELTNVVFTDEC